MRRTLAFALVTIVTLAIGAGVAPARATHFSSTVEFLGANDVFGPDNVIYGRVTSSKGKCVPNRRVQVIYVSNSDPASNHLVDTARTGDNGYWAGHGDFTGADAIKVKLLKKGFGRLHRKVCGGDTDIAG